MALPEKQQNELDRAYRIALWQARIDEMQGFPPSTTKSRLDKALELVKNPQLYAQKMTEYHTTTETCGCPDAGYRGTSMVSSVICKHRLAAMLYHRIDNPYPPGYEEAEMDAHPEYHALYPSDEEELEI